MRAIGFALVLVGCGGGGGPGADPGNAQMTASERATWCASLCGQRDTCGEPTGGPDCPATCEAESELYAVGPAATYLECALESCEGEEANCVFAIERREIDSELSSQCTQAWNRCVDPTMLINCFSSERDWMAQSRRYIPEVVTDLTACYEGACGAITSCIDGVIDAEWAVRF